MQLSIEELKAENVRLSEQIKKQIRTEQQLNAVQQQIDAQVRMYRRLYDIGLQLNGMFDRDSIFQVVLTFVLYNLNFERCIIFVCQTGTDVFHVAALDGYYEEDDAQSQQARTLSADTPALSLLLSNGSHVLMNDALSDDALRSLQPVLGMDEYIIVPLHRINALTMGLIVAGNTREMFEVQSRIDVDSQEIDVLVHLASQVTSALTSVDLHQALYQEQLNLEAKVAERTRELQQAQEALQQQYVKEQQSAAIQQQLQQSLIQMQDEQLRELSTPLIPLDATTLLLPIIGTIDDRRVVMIMETLLEGIAAYQADFAIVDVTGVREVDMSIAQALVRIARSVRLLGACVILSGISPVLAKTLVEIGTDMSDIVLRRTVQTAIAWVMAH